MPLLPLPGEGIELPLSEYNRLRAFQGGGWFWDHENQQVIREMLGDFLPRVEERSTGHQGGAVAVFQHFINNTEVAGKSEAVGAQMNRVPRAEYDRLQTALEALKRKAENPHTDPNARRVIEKFCLPDPAKNPELYRLHGTGWNRRLLVLWGCEREPGTSLAPVAALHKISVEPPAAAWGRRLLWILGLLLLLLLLAFLAYKFWPRHEANNLPGEKSPLTTQDPSFPSPAAPDTVSVSPLPAAATTASSPGAMTPGAMDSTNRPSSSPGVPAAKGPEDANLDRHDAHSNDMTAEENATSSNTPPLPNDSPAVSPTPAGTAQTSERRTTSSTTRDARISPSTTRLENTPSASAAPTGSPGSDNPASASAANPTASPSLDPSSSPVSSPANGQPKVLRQNQPSLAILQEGNPGPPRNGKMDVTLTVHSSEDGLHEDKVTVDMWTVDDVIYQARPGHNATRLSLTLTPGPHQIEVSGTVKGKSVKAQAEVNVQIKSQGDVTVKPNPKR